MQDGRNQAGDEFMRLYGHIVSRPPSIFNEEDFTAAMEEAMKQGGRKAVIDFALASSWLPGVAGPMQRLALPGQEEPVVCTDGFFGHLGPYPFDVALKQGATHILVPLSVPARMATGLDGSEIALFNFFLRQHNPDADAIAQAGMQRSADYFRQIEDTGFIRDKDGRCAAVTMLQPAADEPVLSTIEMRDARLAQSEAFGLAHAGVAIKTARDIVSDRPPAWLGIRPGSPAAHHLAV
jgi:hypothetical protein